MTTVRKTITLTGQQGAWVKTRIASGDFTNDSEYIRDLIRKDQERKTEADSIRTALIAGENSGLSDKNPAQILQAVIKRKRKHGAL